MCIFTQLKEHTETVLSENDINVILEFTYSDDTLNSVSEHIKVNIHYCSHVYINNVCYFIYSKLMPEL